MAVQVGDDGKFLKLGFMSAATGKYWALQDCTLGEAAAHMQVPQQYAPGIREWTGAISQGRINPVIKVKSPKAQKCYKATSLKQS